MRRKHKHMGQVLSTNLAALVERSGDPEKALRQYVTKAQQGRSEILDELIRARAEGLLLQERRGPSHAQARRWGREAEAALRRDDEAEAREALRRQTAAEEAAAAWDRQVAAQEVAIERLELASRQLAEKIAEAELKLSSLASRHRAAQAAVRVEKVLQEMGETDGDLGAFRAIEAAVDGEEALAAAMTEISTHTTDGRKRARQQDAVDKVEERLAALKAKLRGKQSE